MDVRPTVRLSPGEIRELPVRSLNTAMEAADQFFAGRPLKVEDRFSPGGMFSFIPAFVATPAGETEGKREPGEILSVGDPLILPEDNAAIQAQHAAHFKGESVAAEKPFAVLLTPTGPDTYNNLAAVGGYCWARVNITNEDHNFAVAEDGEYVLQSSASGANRIHYKPSGTGEKICYLFTGRDPVGIKLYSGLADGEVEVGDTDATFRDVRTWDGELANTTDNELDGVHYLSPLDIGDLADGAPAMIVEFQGVRRAVPIVGVNCESIRSVFGVPAGAPVSPVLAYIPSFSPECGYKEMRECDEQTIFATKSDMETAVDPTSYFAGQIFLVTDDGSNDGSYMVRGTPGQLGDNVPLLKVGGANA